VAEARLKSTQEQLHKANDAAAEAQDKLYQLQATVEVGSATGSIQHLGLTPQNSLVSHCFAGRFCFPMIK